MSDEESASKKVQVKKYGESQSRKYSRCSDYR